MGIFDFLAKPVRDLFIARPPSAIDALVHRHPDQSLPGGAKVTVRDDEQALFFRNGMLCGVLSAGTHVLQSRHLPFLGDLVVSPLTGDQHYITELFFVRISEQLVSVGPVSVGMHRDQASGHVVQFVVRCRVNLRVVDAAQVVLELGGVRERASAVVESVVQDRIASLIASGVGELAGSVPALDLASNRYSEHLGQQVVAAAEQSLAGTGLRLARLLSLQLSLDGESERALREFGAGQARLHLERQGAEVASAPGFAAYHAAHGQRALLEGIGSGAASGHGPGMLFPFGVGSPLALGMPSTSFPAGGTSGTMPPKSVRLSRPPEAARFELRTGRGIEGPFIERTLELRVRQAGFDPSSSYVRRVGDAGWTPVSDHAATQALLSRALPSPVRSDAPPAATARFDEALELAAADGVLAPAELTMLARIASQSGLTAEGEAARSYVLARARALGLTIG